MKIGMFILMGYLLVCANAVFAQTPFAYGGVSLLATNYSGGGSQDRAVGFRLFGAYQPMLNLSFEAGLVDNGNATVGKIDNAPINRSTSGVDALAVFTYPASRRFDVFGKLGLYVWQMQNEACIGGRCLVKNSKHGTSPELGLGLTYFPNRAMLTRLEFSDIRFKLNHDTTVQTQALAFSFGLHF